MAYMAVGSRQILFSDSISPASTQDNIAQVANFSDNQATAAATESAQPVSSDRPQETVGANLDVRA